MASLTIEVLSGVSAGRIFESDADLIRLGRAPGNDLELPESHVSAEHARLLVGATQVVVEDLESTNGTWVEREGSRFHLSHQAARCVLTDGDVLELGGKGTEGTRLRLRVQPDRERGELLELRPIAELSTDTRGVVDAERLRSLIEALQRIGAASTLQEAAGALATAALDLVPRATHAAVMLRDEAVGTAETVTHGQVPVAFRVRSGGQVLTPGEPFIVPRSIVRKVVRERARVVIADAPSEAMSSESLLGASIYSTIGTPLFKGGELLGVLQLDSRGAPALFSASDAELLSALASNASLAVAHARLIGQLSLAKQQLKKENSFLRSRDRARSEEVPIIGSSRAMDALFRQLEKVVDTRVSVLIQGETGTGKELVASALHYRSKRRDKLFVAQNCAAFSESLLESELFGHKRGAFTGATDDKKGLFELADGGTLFLDEVGELPLSLQAKLLRVLQEGEVRPVGSATTRYVDVRLVTATNRELEAEVKQGRFREDLYYRLRVFPVRVPPLRERRDDVPLLARHFLVRYSHDFGKPVTGFSNEALAVLGAYDWPGNVRELENEVQRLVIQAEAGEQIGAELLSPRVRQIEGILLHAGTIKGNLKEMVEHLERQILLESLREHQNNKSAAARTLGITREGLHKKLKQLGIG